MFGIIEPLPNSFWYKQFLEPQQPQVVRDSSTVGVLKERVIFDTVMSW